MALDEKQQQWFQDFMARQRQEADSLPQEPQPNAGESRASDSFQQRVKAYHAQQQSLAANPVVAIRGGVQAAMADDAIPDPNADSETRTRYDKDTQAAIDGVEKTAKDGTAFDLGGIVKMPSVDAGSIISNPSSIMSMLNPLAWLAPVGDLIGKIPVVHHAMMAMKELMAGAQEHGFDFGRAWDRSGVRMSMEDAFAGFPEQQRGAMIDKAMADYDRHGSGGGSQDNPTRNVTVKQGDGNDVSVEFTETRNGQSTTITETGHFDKDQKTITFDKAHFHTGDNRDGDLPNSQSMTLKVDSKDIDPATGKLLIDDTLKGAVLSQASGLESLIPAGTPAAPGAAPSK